MTKLIHVLFGVAIVLAVFTFFAAVSCAFAASNIIHPVHTYAIVGWWLFESSGFFTTIAVILGIIVL